MKTLTRLLLVVCLCTIPMMVAAEGQQRAPFANFESPQARPLVISRDGRYLFAINTPAASLSIYSLQNPRLPTLFREISVGLEPVSLAVRSQDEVWVVNHLSDSVSVVDTLRGVVVETIQLGDRPGDIVFAGNPAKAFVTSMT